MLKLCAKCNRHVRGAACPFCGSGAVAPPPRAGSARASRAGRLFAVAALGVACGGTVSPSDAGADASKDAAEEFAAQPPYGAPVLDAGVEAATDDGG